MSLKYAARKLSDNHYVLPRVGGMKVEAHAFLSEALYEASEEAVWRQIASGASYEGVTGAYLMPDTHTGYGVPVGSVIVTEDTLIQGGSGYDISCGVLYMKADLLPKNRREYSWLRVDEPLGKEYWAHHNSAANFAVANRHIIVGGIRAATQEVFGADVEVYYEISHNLVQEETLVLPDGTTKKGFVHRKGATRAFPAGHPDLAGTRWEATGHPCLIPGSMYDGAAILFPLAGAYRSACSVNHGSGRLLARGEAKRKLEHKQQRIDDEMASVQRAFGGARIEGIARNHKHVPLDECAHVYKDLDAVLAVLEAEGIARVSSRLYPIANIKGAD